MVAGFDEDRDIRFASPLGGGQFRELSSLRTLSPNTE